MALTSRRLCVGAVGLLLVACSRTESVARVRHDVPMVPSAPGRARVAPVESAAATAVASQAPPTPGLPALAGSAPLVDLEVEGARPAVVFLPLGATTPRPVAVALHGNFDRPEWQCEVWRGILGAHGFILCPRGVPRRDVPASADRWEYGSVGAVEKEIDAGLEALAQRYGEHVDPGPVLLIGFSLGAIYGSPIAQRRPERFPRLVLVEGGLSAWSRANAKAFAAKGGLRLFIACGQAGCLAKATALGPAFEKVGLPTRSGGHAKAGHTYDGEVSAAVAREFPWLVEGDSRWVPP